MNLTTQGCLVLEAVSLIQRPPERRRIEANRQRGRYRAHGRLEQTAADAAAAMRRIHQHHCNPREGAVVDADRRADDRLVGSFARVADRGEGGGGRKPEQHPPVVDPLIPADTRAQPEGAVDVVRRQRPDDQIAHTWVTRMAAGDRALYVIAGSVYGARYVLPRSVFASSSPMNRSVAPSNFSDRPTRYEMFPR